MSKDNIKKLAVLGIFTAIFCLIIILVGRMEKDEYLGTINNQFEKARVLEIVDEEIMSEDHYIYSTQDVVLEILTGEYKGRIVETTNFIDYMYGTYCEVGDTVVTTVSISGDYEVITVYNKYREPVIYGYILFFLLMLCVIGGKKGVSTVISLVFTFVSIIFIVIPLIYQGYSPIIISMLLVISTTIVTLYLIAGWNAKSIAAIIGTIFGVGVAAILAKVVFDMSAITGYNVPDASDLAVVSKFTGLKVNEILFSTLLIASLGAVMDISMTIASSISEVYSVNPSLGTKELFLSGMNVGRDVMGTMANTLILAFTGSSFYLLITMYSFNTQSVQMMNSYEIGVEIIQGISASLAVVLTVPAVSIITALLLKRNKKAT